ncbi:hypothetical protein JFU48_14900 [Pseudomonas sp. TH49]|uniref:VPA1262 family N-terminal domain-containing protein n=1 Tax=Pseudomonas sp. TH49 TaxID=2796413 RepID=UPI001912D8F2|nr:VPA1262 family N-terminal domain-containing protein [Pseudomonas sp. TH49]MBK5342666.1 hypothetical protein [Pseudomonas sp. TH49]
MNQTQYTASNSRDQISPGLIRLLELGVLGHYQWFEVVEVGCSDSKGFLNVFTICVAIEGTPSEEQKKTLFLNGSNRTVNGIANRAFGVVRRYISLESLLQAAARFDTNGEWQPHDAPLLHGKLKASAPAFYAVDGSIPVPLNRVLKNNFWNGSYVVELADSTKDSLRFITDSPSYVEAVGAWVKQFSKIDLSMIPDRLGNIVIQLPVNSIATNFSGSQDNMIGVTVAWHPDVEPRRLSGSIQLVFDEAIVAYGQQELTEGDNSIVADISSRPFRGIVWDLDKNIILAAHPPTTFIGGGGMRGTVSSVGDSVRIFHDVGSDGSKIRREVPLVSVQRTWSHGETLIRPNGVWTERRISDTEIRKLVSLKRFVQYGGKVRGETEHQRSLADIRELVNMHGEDAAYLWDPYLSSADILTTFFYCKHEKSKLRAITSTKVCGKIDKPKCKVCETSKDISPSLSEESSQEPDSSTREHWIIDQVKLLSESIEGKSHIDLEFRISFGPKGWPFHDRFLIFPNGSGNGPEVWSLGASVNHLGSVHAIVQQVAHPQPVVDAFDTLWAHLNSNEHLIWKSV